MLPVAANRSGGLAVPRQREAWEVTSSVNVLASLPQALAAAGRDFEGCDRAPPPAISVSNIFPGEIHAMELTDDLRFGVRLTARPPAEAIVKTSPPVNPSSLINPG